MNQLYLDQKQWQKISLLNIAHAGRFSSDQTVQRYAEEIWQITPLADKYRGKRERYDNYLL
jgi:starch phosphorylase